MRIEMNLRLTSQDVDDLLVALADGEMCEDDLVVAYEHCKDESSIKVREQAEGRIVRFRELRKKIKTQIREKSK
jgi:hypothetical protein